MYSCIIRKCFLCKCAPFGMMPRPICIKAHVKPKRIEREPQAFTGSANFFLSAFLPLPIRTIDASENKTHCFRYCIVSRPASSICYMAKCIFAFDDADGVPVVRPAFYVHDLGYGLLSSRFCFVTLWYSALVFRWYAYTYIIHRVTSPNRDKWIHSGSISFSDYPIAFLLVPLVH